MQGEEDDITYKVYWLMENQTETMLLEVVSGG